MISVLIQTEIESKNSPNLCMHPILGRPIIELIIERLRSCNGIDRIVVVGGRSEEYDELQSLCDILDVPIYREDDYGMLRKLYNASKSFDSEAMVRVLANYPLVDPNLVDDVVNLYLNNRKKYDYCSNINPRTFPRGLEVELYPVQTMEKLFNCCDDNLSMDEYPKVLLKNPEEFRIGNVSDGINRSMMRWVVENLDDIKFVTEIYKALYSPGDCFGRDEVFRLLREHPELMAINAEEKTTGVKLKNA
ncbi:MAG: NTP transferase domain-containing protein [candidate division Zixibacteria bacterium]|nr:NTP transferase domain-containing protein [candidate division Zixibacteria bacterium]